MVFLIGFVSRLHDQLLRKAFYIMDRKNDVIRNIPYSKKCTGPFRATEIWNAIVEIFAECMPRRSHRRQLKMYHNCFTASFAVDVMLEILKRNENIPEDVKREQVSTISLVYLKQQFGALGVPKHPANKLKLVNEGYA